MTLGLPNLKDVPTGHHVAERHVHEPQRRTHNFADQWLRFAEILINSVNPLIAERTRMAGEVTGFDLVRGRLPRFSPAANHNSLPKWLSIPAYEICAATSGEGIVRGRLGIKKHAGDTLGDVP